jgi:hypothetical protein
LVECNGAGLREVLQAVEKTKKVLVVVVVSEGYMWWLMPLQSGLRQLKPS